MKQGVRDSQQRIAFVHLFGEGVSFAEQQEIQVVPTGKWDHPVYGEMEITPDHIAEFVRNFKEKVRLDIPITAGHDNGMSGGELPAIGWFRDLIDQGVKGLTAFVEWTEEGKRLLASGAFKYFSPEFYEEYSDPQTGGKRGHVLVGGALTNKPYFKELRPVAAFSEPDIMRQFTDDMNLKDILSKKPADLSAEEKAFVQEHKSELDASQTEEFKSVLEEPKDEPKDAPKDEPKDAPKDEPASKDDEIDASEKGKFIKVSASEYAALNSAATDGAKALKKIEASERAKLIEQMTFSAKNTEGRFLPKQSKALESFLITLSEGQRKQFSEIVKDMPKPDAKIFSEIGDAGKDTDGSVESIFSEIKGLADAKILASAGKLSFSDALKQVYAEKPELKTTYEQALGESAAA